MTEINADEQHIDERPTITAIGHLVIRDRETGRILFNKRDLEEKLVRDINGKS